MARTRIDLTNQKTIDRLISEGRGLGEGESYMSWLKVQDVPSKGRSYRIQGWRTGNRVVHLLSYLELQHFYMVEWDSYVIDYHEQFPLSRSTTEALATELGIRHPKATGRRQMPDGKVEFVRLPTIMTTDLLAIYERDGVRYKEAYSVKPKRAMEGKGGERTRQKLKLERAYWQKSKIKWFLATDGPIPADWEFADNETRLIDKPLALNVEMVHGYYHLDHFASLTQQHVTQVNDVLLPELLKGEQSLADLAMHTDERLGLPNGASLIIAKHLIARRVWPVDFSRPFHPCRPMYFISGE